MTTETTNAPCDVAPQELVDTMSIEQRLHYYRTSRQPKLHSRSAVQSLELIWIGLTVLWLTGETDADTQREKAAQLVELLELLVQTRAQNVRTRLHEFIANVRSVIALTRAAEGELTAWYFARLQEALSSGVVSATFVEELGPPTSRVYALLREVREAARNQLQLETARSMSELNKDRCKGSVEVGAPINVPEQGVSCQLWVSEEKRTAH